MSERLQLDPHLDLQKAVNAVRQRETVKKQQATLRGTATSTEDTIDTVQRTTLPHKSQKATSRGDQARGTGEIAVVDGNTRPWVMDIQLNGELNEFKIDTGADVTVMIPVATYKASRDKRLQPAGRILYGPSQHPMLVLGKFQGTLQSVNAIAQENIYVVQGLQKACYRSPWSSSAGGSNSDQ